MILCKKKETNNFLIAIYFALYFGNFIKFKN